jgi:tetratricopeptide (TPR) repeat protein
MPQDLNIEQLRQLRLQRFAAPASSQAGQNTRTPSPKSSLLPPESANATGSGESKAEEIEDFFVRDQITTNYLVYPVICNDQRVYDAPELLKRNITHSYHSREPLEILAPDRDRRHYSHSVADGHKEREEQYERFVHDQREAVRLCPPPPAPQGIDQQISLAPHDPVLRLQRAEDLLNKGQHHRALVDFEKVLFMAPLAPRAVTGRTACLAATGCDSSRLNQLNLQIRQEPSAALYLARGLVNQNLKHFSSAAQDLEEAIKLEPANHQAREALAAMCLFEFLDPKRAIELISQFAQSNIATPYTRFVYKMAKNCRSFGSDKQEYKIIKDLEAEFSLLPVGPFQAQAVGFMCLKYQNLILTLRPIPKEVEQFVNRMSSLYNVYLGLVSAEEAESNLPPHVAECIVAAVQGEYATARALCSSAEPTGGQCTGGLEKFIHELKRTEPRHRKSIDTPGAMLIFSRMTRRPDRAREGNPT